MNLGKPLPSLSQKSPCVILKEEAFLIGTPKPPSCYQERVWTDAKEKEEKAMLSAQARPEPDSSGWARLFEEPRVTGTEPAMGEAWSGGTNRALLPPPPPPTPALCPESSCAPRVGERGRSGLAWRSPWAPAADWPVAQGAARQARSWPPGAEQIKRARGHTTCSPEILLGLNHRSSGPGPPRRFSTASRRNLLQARAPTAQQNFGASSRAQLSTAARHCSTHCWTHCSPFF